MAVLLESGLEVALIVLFALALMPLLRKRSAAVRHWVLAAALVCAALAPAVHAIVPAWRLPIALPPPTLAADVSVPSSAGAITVRADRQQARPAVGVVQGIGQDTLLRIAATLWTIWILGAVFGVAVLLVGLAQLARLGRAARPLTRGPWVEPAREIGRSYGLSRPVRLLQSDHPTLLVTWGVLRPRILLPAGAGEWEQERVRLVLSHELAHVRRRDWLVQLAAELLRALYWFNPVLWIACRRLRAEGEQACDDAVLANGVEGSRYAAQLVQIARELHQRTWLPAPSIARTSNLERRIRAMLDARVNRRPISRQGCAAALLAVLAVAVPVTGIAVAQNVFATVTGSIVDVTEGAVPDVTLVLTNVATKARNEVRSDRTGRYEFVGLPAGEYLLEASAPGFAALHGRLTLDGQSVNRNLKLQVGSLQETISVRANPARPETQVPASPDFRALVEARRQRAAQRCNTRMEAGTPIGGDIRPPRKLYDMRPVYPASALSAGVEGSVVLEGVIGTDGTMEDVRVVSTPHPDLAAAAVDAVRQWQFDATLLNCVAIPVKLGITVDFARER
jgi:TonB family protein